ncbi:hypothetical protein [Calidifontibacillus erzurumensis]|uniref:hypothetical protein n=1 Tax=Calidifontibacillus erzurumensis TaxID=2741433 RepID=UPI0035B4FEBD
MYDKNSGNTWPTSAYFERKVGYFRYDVKKHVVKRKLWRDSVIFLIHVEALLGTIQLF